MKTRSRTLEVLKAVRGRWAAAFALVLTAIPNVVYSQQKSDQPQKPNILVIMGDDIGWFNASCYNHGMMGYETPNIDRIAKEGARFLTPGMRNKAALPAGQLSSPGNNPSAPDSPKLVHPARM
jgi:hypothetical protein